MASVSQELQVLLNNLHEAEARLNSIESFDANGGRYRVSIVVDHPDWGTKDAVERLAKAHLPNTAIVKGLVTFAKKDLDKAREALLAAAVAHTLVPATQDPEIVSGGAL